MSASSRAARLDRPAGHRATAAVSGDLPAAALAAAGWRVSGRVPRTPWADPQDAPSYVDLAELLDDPRVDAVAVDGTDAGLLQALPVLREQGLLVLLAAPAPLDVDVLRAARAVDGPDVAVALLQRWEPWARLVAAALPLAGGPVLQATVRGWPRGDAAAAELVDLARAWCGDVAAVAASPEALPAAELPGGARVHWALLAESGATVLISHDDGPPLARLSFASARLEAGPLGARWVGGAELPLPPAEVAEHEAPMDEPPPLPRPLPPPGTPAGLVACAAALRAAVTTGEVRAFAWPWPADLADLLAAARVLEALREASRADRPVRVA